MRIPIKGAWAPDHLEYVRFFPWLRRWLLIVSSCSAEYQLLDIAIPPATPAAVCVALPLFGSLTVSASWRTTKWPRFAMRMTGRSSSGNQTFRSCSNLQRKWQITSCTYCRFFGNVRGCYYFSFEDTSMNWLALLALKKSLTHSWQKFHDSRICSYVSLCLSLIWCFWFSFLDS
jgi:hypothetical protein